ncbi:hypothetical protein UFOVP119_2 [uncultured Caudovirales phage]|uniref:Uncharacterized protein n=1 Tax=uncultured Caudovirales phage TaxID=2100421 RepID=A0A6J5L6Y7_9CAUD|nr:hypothetical protein UFOVP119_2 [uncultured Caudovirales phage]
MSERDEQARMIEDCEKREGQLSEWEQNFIQSLNERVGRGFSLTDRQSEKLEAIWERVT